MKSARITCLALSLVFVTASTTTAGLILDRQPYNSGGPAADSEFLFQFSEIIWADAADDFQLSAPATLSRIDWWGFYGSSFGEGVRPPIGDEVMRIRLLTARDGDGLPGEIVHEEYHTNPDRTLTGRFVSSSAAYPERKYRVDLDMPVSLDADTPYWLNITQVGAPESLFRWEYSLTPPLNDYALNWSYEPFWQHSGSSSAINLAFQLHEIPEPCAIGLWFLFAMWRSPTYRIRNTTSLFARRH